MDINESKVKSIIDTVTKIEKEVSKHMIGQKDLIRQVLISILAGGNVLLEGVPGLGKTRLVKTLGKVMELQFKRIQFTPDLMPADISGTNIITKSKDGSGAFSFQEGPIFSNIVLADEINRATPKTQSALLEAMQEKTVTVGNTTYSLPEPFFVLATQNPLEMEGTYPLPEAQLDRFLFKLNVPFPSLEEIMNIVSLTTEKEEETLNAVTKGEDILSIRNITSKVPVAKAVLEFASKLVLATHPDSQFATSSSKKYIRYGSSPRGAQAIISTAKIRALLEGRYNVAFEDIKYVAYPALRHRFFLNFDGLSEGITTDKMIDDIIKELES
ncbi:UNVERIFIED_CONTAM: MoxR-like ATPase [Acetivibrio alkalicellulosi]